MLKTVDVDNASGVRSSRNVRKDGGDNGFNVMPCSGLFFC